MIEWRAALRTTRLEVDISVIICTYNRAESLRRTLQTCCDLVITAGVTWELLVVDNNSTDATKQVCNEFTGKLPLRYLFESRQGKSFALNQGVVVATGDLLSFTDDDVDLAPNYLDELWQAAIKYPAVSVFGGKILPRWENPPPRWMSDNAKLLLSGVTVHFDRGDVEHVLADGKSVFYGANMAIRKIIFEKGFRYREDLGLDGSRRIGAEDVEFMRAILTAGYKALYMPKAIVHHRNSRKRMAERYVREWFIGYGMSEVRCGAVNRSHCWFGAPRHAWKTVVLNGAKYLATRWTCPSRVWLPAEIKMATTWGEITEMRRQAILKNRENTKL